MALNEKRYLLTNLTVRAPRVDPKTGKDDRTAIERGGHAISYRDEQDRVVILQPKSQPHIVSKLNEGMMRLHQEGLMGIREVENFSEILALRQQSGQRTERRGLKKQTIAENEVQPSGRRAARAVEMGRDDAQQQLRASEAEDQGAVNPDGQPNFVVTAPSASTRRRRAEKRA